MAATADRSSDAARDPIEVMAESFLERFRRGERPSIDDYAARHPELADEIRELLPALVQLEQDLSVAGDATGSVGGGAAAAATLRAPPGSSATTRSSARSAAAAWAWSMRPSSSRSAATSP